MQKRARGNLAEDLAAKHFAEQGFTIRDRNRTIRGGELDIVCEQADLLVFVEVRSVDTLDDLHEYMTPRKLGHLVRTIQHYVLIHQRQGAYRLDVVFVRHEEILHRYQNVTNS